MYTQKRQNSRTRLLHVPFVLTILVYHCHWSSLTAGGKGSACPTHTLPWVNYERPCTRWG